MTTHIQLFGGAITMDLLNNFIDASDLRQVPDTQEVFLDTQSDMSIIVEILQRVDMEEAEEAAKFHFDSLAHDNSASSEKILNIMVPSEQPGSPSSTPSPILLRGEQEIKKFNRSICDQVSIFMALYRVEAKNVDLVLTVNLPLDEEKTSPIDEEALQVAQRLFDTAVSSLKIVDFSLFV